MKTVIEITPAASGMANILFDDGTSLVVGHETIGRYGIKVGQTIDEITLEQIISEAGGDLCYEAALRCIESHQRSENEIRRHLLSKHLYSTAAIDHSIQRLKQNGLLDDASFAKAWVRDRIQFKPKSRLMIQYELMQKGISPDNIADATRDIDDFASAYQAGSKKARSLHSDDRFEFSRRLSAYLSRRGYTGEVVHEVVNRLWQENLHRNPNFHDSSPGATSSD